MSLPPFLRMQDLKDFYNDGFGWICRRCERELHVSSNDNEPRSRLMSEGEAESKQPRMSNHALAKWADKIRSTLVCPRCGIIELVERS